MPTRTRDIHEPPPNRRAPRRSVSLTACGALLVGLAGGAAAQPGVSEPTPRPALFVIVTVDQMRYDYIERYADTWTGGLRRLVDEGAVFVDAAYPYLHTVTCAGHATIGTGTFPATHGAIMNDWWDREEGRVVTCTEDEAAVGRAFGGSVDEGQSARRLLVPTFADELRAQQPVAPRIVSLSMKARSALMPAGHRADVALWFEPGAGWVTSAGYDGRTAFVEEVLRSHPLDAERDRVWTLLQADSEYRFADDGPGERPRNGWTPLFPHPLVVEEPSRWLRLWERSPFADDYLGELARAAVSSLELGQGPGRTDFLAVSFSALDRVGHWFGPDSRETEDVVRRLDRTLALLLDDLDQRVGRDRYVLALTADHGVGPIPEASTSAGKDAGRFDREGRREVVARINAVLGPGEHVLSMRHTDVYLDDTSRRRLEESPELVDALIADVEQIPGVARVLFGPRLLGRPPADAVERAAVLSYHPERSGDLLIVPQPYWIITNDAATHGTYHEYDQRVPLILRGPGIVPGTYRGPATPADIAPTFAALAGITLARPDGRALDVALDGATRSPTP